MKNGWPRKKLGDVILEMKDGGTPSRTRPDYFGGDVNWCVVRDIKPQIYDTTEKLTKEGLNNCSAKVWPIDSVIISLGATIGQIGIAKVQTATKQGLSGIIVDRHQITPEFLAYGLHEQKEHIQSLATGTTIKEIRPTKLKESISLFVPPLAEQQRIVGVLNKTFAGLATAQAHTERNLQNARALFEGLLNAAIQGSLIPRGRDSSAKDLIRQLEKLRNTAVADGRAKPVKRPARFGSENRGSFELPKGWECAPLEDMTVCISDGVHKKPHYVSKGIPFVTVRNLTSGSGISFDDLNYITREDHEEFIKRTHPEKGDILVTKDGTIGVVRRIETDVEFSIFVSVALIKPVMREIAPFLAYALRAACVQNQIVPQGAALKHLYLVDLRRLVIPLPPLTEQQRIVETLDACAAETQRLESLYQHKHAALAALKESLLHRAFSGAL